MATVPQSEAGFQDAVVEYAQLRGWRHWHDQDSRRNVAGLPDLLLVRKGRLVVAELKAESGRVSPAQLVWLGEFELVAQASGGAVAVHVWRPSDWPTIEDVLR